MFPPPPGKAPWSMRWKSRLKFWTPSRVPNVTVVFQAKDCGQLENKWLMINIQNVQDFACQCLNRDVWSNEAVRTIIREHFIFWQVRPVSTSHATSRWSASPTIWGSHTPLHGSSSRPRLLCPLTMCILSVTGVSWQRRGPEVHPVLQAKQVSLYFDPRPSDRWV